MPCKGQEEESQTIIQLEIGFFSLFFRYFLRVVTLSIESINVPKVLMIFDRRWYPLEKKCLNVFRQTLLEIDSTGKEHKIPWHNNQQNSFFPPGLIFLHKPRHTHIDRNEEKD
jgi:hypothetical protein